MGIASAILLTATAFLPNQGRPGGRVAGGWQGLAHKNVLKQLSDHKTKKLAGVSFAYGVIRDQKTFDAILKAGATRPYNAGRSLPRWASSLDWNRQVVVCVIRTAPTNSLKVARLGLSPDRTMTLELDFSAIEPSYGEHYPIVLYRFTPRRRKKIAIAIDMSDGKEKPISLARVDLLANKSKAK